MDVPVTMHYKFQQSSPIYSGWCLRFCSSTESWLLQLLHRDRAHSANCSEDLDSMGQFWEGVDTPVGVANDRAMILTVQKTTVILQLQSLKRWSIWVCRSCSSSVLSWRRQSSSHNCSRRALDQVVDMPVDVQRQGFSQWRCHRYSSSPVYVDIQLCNTDGYDVSSIFAYGSDDGFFDAFCVIFPALAAMPELSASFSSPRR